MESSKNERVAELMDRVGRMVHAIQFVEGLNPAQWEALRFLAQANRYSRVPGALADYMGSTKGTVSRTLRALESKGYIVCRRGGGPDRRVTRLDVTPAGHALLARDPVRGLEKSLAELPEDMKTAMAEGLSRVLTCIRQRCQQSEFGQCEYCDHLTAKDQCDAGGHCCGLTGDDLNDEDRRRICINYKPSAA